MIFTVLQDGSVFNLRWKDGPNGFAQRQGQQPQNMLGALHGGGFYGPSEKQAVRSYSAHWPLEQLQ